VIPEATLRQNGAELAYRDVNPRAPVVENRINAHDSHFNPRFEGFAPVALHWQRQLPCDSHSAIATPRVHLTPPPTADIIGSEEFTRMYVFIVAICSAFRVVLKLERGDITSRPMRLLQFVFEVRRRATPMAFGKSYCPTYPTRERLAEPG
jgi:hypothetical protein